jgi:geranylgeranyl transferase type-1 subunit beta
LINTLDTTEVDNESTIRWLAQRQIGGFQGRPGKLEDVCYSFWCGAALKVSQSANFSGIRANGLQILGADVIINKDEDKDFLLSAQSPMGGFGKEPEDYPDPYHSYLALAALALHQDPLVALKTLDAQLNIPEDTASWLRTEMDRIKSVES